MGVYAITTILHGVKGETKTINVGDELKGFSDDELRAFIVGGSAVETGSNRKFTAEPGPAAAADEATRKRDELLAKAAMGEIEANDSNEPNSPVVQSSAGAPAAQAGGSKTIQQVASDSIKS